MKTKKYTTRNLSLLIFMIVLTNNGFSQSNNCDDFTTYNWQPTGDTLGYTQSVYPITNIPYLDTASFQYGWLLNQQNGDPGMYGIISGAMFMFNGTNQQVTYEMYAFYNQFNQTGFSVNGSAPVMLNNTFPTTIAGVTVSLDTTAANVDSFEGFYLSFSGNIDSIKIYTLESGIVKMCVEPADTTCDDFTTYNWQPTGDTLGYTQSVYPIINIPYLDTAYFQYGWLLNQQNGNPGMYGIISGALFMFNGNNQQVTYEMYAFYNQFNQMGFSVNGSAPVMLNNTFPTTIAGVTISLDTSAANVNNFEGFYLSFSGNIDSIKIYTFESGIVKMCVEPVIVNSISETNGVLSLNVYPNPTSERINITNEKAISQHTSVSLINIQGQEILSKKIDFNGFYSIDVTDLNTGIYFLKLQNEKDAYTSKVLIQK